jgi:hypothetical protein
LEFADKPKPPLAFFQQQDLPTHLTKLSEDKLDYLEFTVHKLNSRVKPTKKERVVIVGCFSEFGCETLGCMYCIPRLLKRYPGRYIIAMGWYGRKYLYQHLVDEFWELDEKYMWLRDYARAFHHLSDNLKRAEEAATAHGMVVPSGVLGKYAIGNFCRTCGRFWSQWHMRNDECYHCKSTVLIRSIFSDPQRYTKEARPIPKPKPELLEWAKGIVGEKKTVGLFARGRKTYGRNLPPDFYTKLIEHLRGRGYNVIWLGEKQSTQACPVDDVIDFSRMPESRELERTLAIICNCEFTVQFWTASSRLAGMMGVPFLLVESPEQIYASGLYPAQEGKRLELASFGPRKIVLSHYIPSVEDQPALLKLTEQAITEMESGNYDEMTGLCDSDAIDSLHREHEDMQHTSYEDYYKEILNVQTNK